MGRKAKGASPRAARHPATRATASVTDGRARRSSSTSDANRPGTLASLSTRQVGRFGSEWATTYRNRRSRKPSTSSSTRRGRRWPPADPSWSCVASQTGQAGARLRRASLGRVVRPRVLRLRSCGPQQPWRRRRWANRNEAGPSEVAASVSDHHQPEPRPTERSLASPSRRSDPSKATSSLARRPHAPLSSRRGPWTPRRPGASHRAR